jgi:hypothetical protein
MGFGEAGFDLADAGIRFCSRAQGRIKKASGGQGRKDFCRKSASGFTIA